MVTAIYCVSKNLGLLRYLGPVVQSIVSLMKSLIHLLVEYMLTTLSNTQLFFMEKCKNAKDSHIFLTKNNSGFVIFTL